MTSFITGYDDDHQVLFQLYRDCKRFFIGYWILVTGLNFYSAPFFIMLLFISFVIIIC